jgi:hypothetical protein
MCWHPADALCCQRRRPATPTNIDLALGSMALTPVRAAHGANPLPLLANSARPFLPHSAGVKGQWIASATFCLRSPSDPHITHIHICHTNQREESHPIQVLQLPTCCQAPRALQTHSSLVLTLNITNKMRRDIDGFVGDGKD